MTPHQTPHQTPPCAKFAPLIGIGFMGFACVLAVKLASQHRFGLDLKVLKVFQSALESLSKLKVPQSAHKDFNKRWKHGIRQTCSGVQLSAEVLAEVFEGLPPGQGVSACAKWSGIAQHA